MNIVNELEQLGLTAGESRVYLALVETDKSTVGPIVRKSRISPSKVYDVLNRLIRKGIVSSVVGGKTRYFRAVSPDRLRILIDDKRDQLNMQLERQEKVFKNIMPELIIRTQRSGADEHAELLEGIRGIKNFFEMMLKELKPGETELVLGYTKYSGELFDEYFMDYNNRCREKGIKTRVIFDHEGWFRKKRRKRPHASYRYLPKSIKATTFMGIYHDKVGIMIVTEKQKLCILIKNKEVAESYKVYFEFMWAQSIEPKPFYKS